MVNPLRMPVIFGPSGSPRYCPVDHVQYDPATSHKRVTAYAVFETTEHAISRVLPPGLVPRGQPLISFEFIYLTELQWLAGRGYNMLNVRIPVRYQGGERDGPLDGWFQPVIWENLCDPIISGREELGWAKIYAELSPPRRMGDEACFDAAWDGFTFLSLQLSGLQVATQNPVGTGPVIHHKYIPATGSDGADVDCFTVTPVGGPLPTLLLHEEAQGARLSIDRPRWEDMPTQFQIVNGLADIPLHALVRAGVFQSQGGKDLSDQYRLY